MSLILLLFLYQNVVLVTSTDVTLPTLVEKLKQLEMQVEEMLKERDVCKSAIKEILEENSRIKQTLTSLTLNRQRKALGGLSHVAFTARLSHDLHNLGIGQIIVFDVKISDFGNNYDNSDGIFVAPVSGYYVFTWTIGTRDDRNQMTALVKNGREIEYSVADSSGNDDAQASNTVVLLVNTGEHVMIKTSTERWHVPNNYVIEHDIANTFSGWLLFETY